MTWIVIYETIWRVKKDPLTLLCELCDNNPPSSAYNDRDQVIVGHGNGEGGGEEGKNATRQLICKTFSLQSAFN